MRVFRSFYFEFLASAACLVATASPFAADATTIDVQFATVRESLTNAVPYPNQAGVGVGGNFVDTGLAGILFYALPASAPSQAELSIVLSFARDRARLGQVPDSFNVDLYALGTRARNTVNEPGDYGDLSNCPGASCPGTLLRDNWWIAGDDSQIGTAKTLDVTSVVLSAYRDGAPIDNYLVFGLYADKVLGNNDYTGYSFTPEPSTGLLVAAGMAMLAFSGRRKGSMAIM